MVASVGLALPMARLTISLPFLLIPSLSHLRLLHLSLPHPKSLDAHSLSDTTCSSRTPSRASNPRSTTGPSPAASGPSSPSSGAATLRPEVVVVVSRGRQRGGGSEGRIWRQCDGWFSALARGLHFTEMRATRFLVQSLRPHFDLDALACPRTRTASFKPPYFRFFAFCSQRWAMRSASVGAQPTLWLAGGAEKPTASPIGHSLSPLL